MGKVINLDIYRTVPLDDDEVIDLFTGDGSKVNGLFEKSGFNKMEAIEFRCGHIHGKEPVFCDDKVSTVEEVLELYRVRMLDGDYGLQLFACQKFANEGR